MPSVVSILHNLQSLRIWLGDDITAYRDVAVLYHEGIFYLFPTVIRTEEDGSIFFQTAVSTSHDLRNFSEPKPITPKDQHLNYSSPGNVVRHADEWVLCLQTYPIPDYRRADGFLVGNQDSRIWIMRSDDLLHWSDPELLRVKGSEWRGRTWDV